VPSNPPSSRSFPYDLRGDERKPRVLVVEDDDDFARILIHLLGKVEPLDFDRAASAAEARPKLASRAYDVVITDVSMPEESGISLMRWSQERHPWPVWIVLTGHGTLDTAVKALKLGAFDFLTKPVTRVEVIERSLKNALTHQRLRAERDGLHADLENSNEQLKKRVEELEEAYRVLREQAEHTRTDLHRAGVIQRALLPETAPPLAGFHVDAVYLPSHTVGGDIYDVVRLNERYVALFVADAAGHGLAAAMLAVLFRCQLTLVDPTSQEARSPGDALRAANNALCDELDAPGLFLTAACCLLDTKERTATIASAGHPPLLVLRAGADPLASSLEQVFHTGPAVGLYRDAEYAEQEICLEPGDRLLFYSDGLYDRLARDSSPAGEQIAARLAVSTLAPHAALEQLIARANTEGLDEPPEDDITVLLLDATPGPSQLDNGALPAAPASTQSEARFEVLVGHANDRTTFSIQGRADWTRSAAINAECSAALTAGRAVTIDLTLCECLDSTLLGTLHELSELADTRDLDFRLQGVAPAVEELFGELEMKLVIERIVPVMLPLPSHMESLAGESDAAASARVVLRAHERLASLSDANRDEFGPVVAELRREIRRGPS
jgi:serine phosphatase RsbU (regulator of sigma subunit)/anti-anti-sigma regulatory factor